MMQLIKENLKENRRQLFLPIADMNSSRMASLVECHLLN
jgi:hypothetical protein